MPDKDYYKALGVSGDAKLEEIQRVYRQLAMRYHPDRNQENRKQAEEKFKEISEAYYVLSDEKRRQEYDMFRRYGGQQGPGYGFQGAQGFDFEEILKHFGGGSFRVRTSRGGRGAGVNFNDIFDIFSHMGGGGGGEEYYSSSNFDNTDQPMQENTDINAGLSVPKNVAQNGGEVLFRHEGKKITLKIKAGTRSGQKLRIKDQGKPCRCCGHRGDLIVTIR